jgi:hypothetical protein
MNIDYSFFQKGYGSRDWNRFARLPFRSALKIDYASKALPVSQTPAAIVEDEKLRKHQFEPRPFAGFGLWSDTAPS